MTQNRILCLLITTATLAQGQLHILTGSASDDSNEQFGSAIFRVGTNGDVKQISQVVPNSIGAAWIDVSYDWRKAVFLTLGADNSVVVADFDKAAVVKKCAAPITRGTSWLYAWLADSPVLGPSYSWLSAGGTGADPRDLIVDEMVLDPAVSCKDSFQTLDPTNSRYLVTHGTVGIDGAVSNSHGRFNIDIEGARWVVSGFATKPFPMGYEVPAAILRGMVPVVCNIDVNDSHELTLSVFDKVAAFEAGYRVLVFRKSDKTWHMLPIASERRPSIRGFGRYLAVTETQVRNERNPKSAGASEWTRHKRKYGPILDFAEESWPVTYPGRLHLYDIETERVFSINTGQGDSEVLLVEGGNVYYRVEDQLYSAALTDGGVGKPELLARDEVVLDAHWAWLKH
jgi:hypothetical protein